VDVLLVSDDEDLLLVLVYALERRGHTVATTSLGNAARAQWRDRWAQVIVIDDGLPHDNGRLLAEHRRTDAPAPCILLTPRPDSLVSASRLGWAAALLKPFQLADLARAIEGLGVCTGGEPAGGAEQPGHAGGR
jgi:DNA-binding response OmpR family regulator